MRSTIVNILIALLFFQNVSATFAENTINCRIEIQMDDHPEEVMWEIRGPIPSLKVVDGKSYNDYNQNVAGLKIEETMELQAGESYYLLVSDYHNNGIQNGGFKLIAEYPDAEADGFTNKDITMAEIEGSKMNNEEVIKFEVPASSESTVDKLLHKLRGSKTA